MDCAACQRKHKPIDVYIKICRCEGHNGALCCVDKDNVNGEGGAIACCQLHAIPIPRRDGAFVLHKGASCPQLQGGHKLSCPCLRCHVEIDVIDISKGPCGKEVPGCSPKQARPFIKDACLFKDSVDEFNSGLHHVYW